MNTKIGILLLLMVISAALLFTAIKLWRGLRDSEQAQQQKDEERGRHLEKSLGLIAQTTLQDDLSLSEAAIRAKMLLDHLIPEERARQKYQAIYALHDATEHFDRGDARNALTLKARLEQDEKRQKLEELHRQGVLQCMQSILKDGFR